MDKKTKTKTKGFTCSHCGHEVRVVAGDLIWCNGCQRGTTTKKK